MASLIAAMSSICLKGTAAHRQAAIFGGRNSKGPRDFRIYYRRTGASRIIREAKTKVRSPVVHFIRIVNWSCEDLPMNGHANYGPAGVLSISLMAVNGAVGRGYYTLRSWLYSASHFS